MTDTSESVVETPVPDANAPSDAQPESSPGAVDTSEKSEAPRKSGEQKRIDELTWHRRNAERQNRRLESELAQLREQLARQGRPREEERARLESNSAPKTLADFEYDEVKYNDYVRKELKEQLKRELQSELRSERDQERNESERKESTSKFRQREAELRKELEDYEDYAYTAPIDNVADIILSMDEGPRIAYYLGKNPETAARINSLPPHLAAVELGRIDARLASERAQANAKPVSKAPPPPPKIDATEPALEKDPTQMTDKEFAKWRKQHMTKR